MDARYEDYDLVDDMQLSAFLTKERYAIGYDSLGAGFYKAMAVFKFLLTVESDTPRSTAISEIVMPR